MRCVCWCRFTLESGQVEQLSSLRRKQLGQPFNFSNKSNQDSIHPSPSNFCEERKQGNSQLQGGKQQKSIRLSLSNLSKESNQQSIHPSPSNLCDESSLNYSTRTIHHMRRIQPVRLVKFTCTLPQHRSIIYPYAFSLSLRFFLGDQLLYFFTL